MAHYAFLNSQKIVVEVIVGRDENDHSHGVSDWEAYYANVRGLECKRTSYNTHIDDNGVSQHREGGTPFRGTYAGIGYFYDVVFDVFLPPPTPEANDETV